MNNIIVTGIGTSVGKTVVSGILVNALKGEYWKPVQCGPKHDREFIHKWNPSARIHPSCYSLNAPLSPHHAARLEGIRLDFKELQLPQSSGPLIIESAGGILVPFSLEACFLDYFKQWQALWIVVSRHYLGSINHTLMTLEILQQKGVENIALIFNGLQNPDSEQAILSYSKVPCMGRILPERYFGKKTIQRYAKQWNLSI